MSKKVVLLLLLTICSTTVLFFLNLQYRIQPTTVRSQCFIEPWNRVETHHLPHFWSHSLYKYLNLSRQNNLSRDFSILSAFTHRDHISIVISSLKLYKSRVYCRYMDCRRQELPESRSPAIVFPESVIFCERRVGAEYVSVTMSAEEDVDEMVPVLRRDFEEYHHDFAVCMSPLYGDEPKWLQIAEFFEHHKLQGATFFFVYILQVSGYDQKILKNYQKSGEIDVIEMEDHIQRPALLYQQIQIQDCHQRSKNYAKWVAFIDIDERFEVFSKRSGLEVLREIVLGNERVAEIEIQVRRILKIDDSPKQFEGLKQIREEVSHVKYCNSTGPSWNAMKMIVRPEKIAIISVHHVIARYPNTQKMRLDPKIGHFRHYRNTKFRDFGKNWEKSGNHTFEHLPIEPEFGRNLTKNIEKKIEKIYRKIKFDCSSMNKESWEGRGMIDPCLKLPNIF